jgi:hypothetical protein
MLLFSDGYGFTKEFTPSFLAHGKRKMDLAVGTEIQAGPDDDDGSRYEKA